MADRAGGEGNPGVPKEVFELDKDERWQARLEEARARREIALREKAAGKPQKPRPKPWEVDGAEGDAPPEINPIIQDRGDDKFDFADRLESIRGTQTETPVPAPLPSEPPKTPASRPRATPDFNPAARQKVPAAQGAGLEPRARPQPSLILPGAPDVAELAERYAATLHVVEDDPVAESEPEQDPKEQDQGATLVPLTRTAPDADPASESDAGRKLTRAERRRGIRPLGMALALTGLAALPFATEAPPLETGPEMPNVTGFRFQPALGVTWSLSNRPFETRSGEWSPATAPAALATVPFTRSATVTDTVVAPTPPSEPGSGAVEWSGVNPVSKAEASTIYSPGGASETLPQVSSAPVPVAPTVESTSPPVPRAAITGTAPDAAPITPAEDSATDIPENTAPVSAPPRPDTLLQDEAVTPPIAPAPPAPQQRPQTVVETVVEEVSDPLRVTILAPPRADRKVADDLAADVARAGHELVRVKDVEFSINERNLRYFHEDDRASAARMAARYDAELRDFTWFRPRPTEGTAELWLSGRSTEGAASGNTAPTRADPVDPATFLGRVFDRLGLSAELPRILPDADGGN